MTSALLLMRAEAKVVGEELHERLEGCRLVLRPRRLHRGSAEIVERVRSDNYIALRKDVVVPVPVAIVERYVSFRRQWRVRESIQRSHSGAAWYSHGPEYNSALSQTLRRSRHNSELTPTDPGGRHQQLHPVEDRGLGKSEASERRNACCFCRARMAGATKSRSTEAAPKNPASRFTRERVRIESLMTRQLIPNGTNERRNLHFTRRWPVCRR
jgi:hypothetical protein